MASTTSNKPDRTAAIQSVFTPQVIVMIVAVSALAGVFFIVGYYDPTVVPAEGDTVEEYKRILFDWSIAKARALLIYISGKYNQLVVMCFL